MFLNFNSNIWNRKTVNRLRGECTLQQIALLSSRTPNKSRNKLIKHSNNEKARVKNTQMKKKPNWRIGCLTTYCLLLSVLLAAPKVLTHIYVNKPTETSSEFVGFIPEWGEWCSRRHCRRKLSWRPKRPLGPDQAEITIMFEYICFIDIQFLES